MTKTELVMNVMEATGLPRRDADKAVNAVFDAITTGLSRGESVQLVGFGTFEVRHREARTGRNPQTGEEIPIPATDVPAFKPGKALKDAVN